MNRPRVLLADDHQMFADALKSFWGPDAKLWARQRTDTPYWRQPLVWCLTSLYWTSSCLG